MTRTTITDASHRTAPEIASRLPQRSMWRPGGTLGILQCLRSGFTSKDFSKGLENRYSSQHVLKERAIHLQQKVSARALVSRYAYGTPEPVPA